VLPFVANPRTLMLLEVEADLRRFKQIKAFWSCKAPRGQRRGNGRSRRYRLNRNIKFFIPAVSVVSFGQNE
jgi:hypothetical protein